MQPLRHSVWLKWIGCAVTVTLSMRFLSWYARCLFVNGKIQRAIIFQVHSLTWWWRPWPMFLGCDVPWLLPYLLPNVSVEIASQAVIRRLLRVMSLRVSKSTLPAEWDSGTIPGLQAAAGVPFANELFDALDILPMYACAQEIENALGTF